MVAKIWVIHRYSIFESYQRNWHKNKLSNIVLFDRDSNFQLGVRLLKVRYPKFTVMRGVEYTVLLFFNDVSKIPILIKYFLLRGWCKILLVLVYITSLITCVNRNIKSLRIKNIGIFSGNNTRMSGYFIGMHRYLWISFFSIHHIGCIIQHYSYKYIFNQSS